MPIWMEIHPELHIHLQVSSETSHQHRIPASAGSCRHAVLMLYTKKGYHSSVLCRENLHAANRNSLRNFSDEPQDPEKSEELRYAISPLTVPSSIMAIQKITLSPNGKKKHCMVESAHVKHQKASQVSRKGQKTAPQKVFHPPLLHLFTAPHMHTTISVCV